MSMKASQPLPMQDAPPSVASLTNSASSGSALLLRPVVIALGACVLMALSAQVRFFVPGTDVPMTLQPVAMLVIGLTMPAASAVSGMGLYLAAGSVGLPVFAAPMGVWGPTGGYLLGFVPAVLVAGVVAGVGQRSYVRLVLAGACAMTVVFVCGVAWRTVWLGGNLPLAVYTGLTPFVLKAVVEVLLAGWVARMVHAARVRYAACSIESVGKQD